MPQKDRLALVAFLLTGALLVVTYVTLPDPLGWKQADEAAIAEARRVGEKLAAATFGDWQPQATPVVVTKGTVNYMVDFPVGAAGAPTGKAVKGTALSVVKLDKPVLPLPACTALYVADRPVVVIIGASQLDQLLNGMNEGFSAGRGGEEALIRGLTNLSASSRRITGEEYVGGLLHEAFHAYQLPVFEAWQDRIPSHTDDKDLWSMVYTDAENDRLQVEEGELLLAAIRAPDDATARAKAQAFLAVRERRLAYWTGRQGAERAEALLEWERLNEWLEGLARYIQIRTWDVAGYHGTAESNREVMVGHVGTPVDPQWPRERISRLGSSQALVLDRLLPGWHEEAGKGVPLTVLLKNAR